MRKIRNILYTALAVACYSMLPSGCIKEDVAALEAGERHNAAVQLNVATRAVTESDGTLTADEAAIHTLRVYAFVGGKPAGHYFTDNVTLDAANSWHHFMDITFYTDGVQTVDFYAVANEGAMIGNTAALTENTTEAQLKNLWFTDYQGNISQYGLPMFCDKKSFDLDFTKVKAESPDDPGHADHSWLDYDNIAIDLRRPFGKLGVFAAKPEGETATLRVTGLAMLEQGTRLRNYLMTPTTEQLEGIQHASGDITLPVVDGGVVTAELAAGINDAGRQNPGNYTPVLNAPFYPFENPYANGGAWNIPGTDGKEHVLKIDYAFDGEPRTGLVYLPAVVRNTYYAVCCLMHNDGKITVEYTVADWDDGGEYEIEFNYPQYTNPIQPEDGSTLNGPNAQYKQPEVWYSTTDEGSYTFQFRITGPTNQHWTPTLVGTLGTFEHFAVKVYQGNKPTDPTGYLYDNTRENNNNNLLVASPDPYYITVKALKAENKDEEVGLAISYDRDWSSAGSALLLINGLTNNLKWAGSDVAEVIMIKQIEAPEGEDNESTIND